MIIQIELERLKALFNTKSNDTSKDVIAVITRTQIELRESYEVLNKCLLLNTDLALQNSNLENHLRLEKEKNDKLTKHNQWLIQQLTNEE